MVNSKDNERLVLESQLSEVVSGVKVPDDMSKMQEELNKLRAESKSLK